MADTTTLMYVFMGIMYVLMFLVVGTFLVMRNRRSEAREAEKEAEERERELQQQVQQQTSSTRKRLEDSSRIQKFAEGLEATLDESDGLNPDDVTTSEVIASEDNKSDSDKKED